MNPDNPAERVQQINRWLTEGSEQDLTCALAAIDDYTRDFPRGQPEYELRAALERDLELESTTLRRLLHESLKRTNVAEANELVTLGWHRCEALGPEALDWFVDEVMKHLARVEPGHLDEDHALLTLLAQPGTPPTRLARVLNRALHERSFGNYGVLLAPFLERSPLPSADFFAQLAHAFRFGDSIGYLTRALQNPAIDEVTKQHLRRVREA